MEQLIQEKPAAVDVLPVKGGKYPPGRYEGADLSGKYYEGWDFTGCTFIACNFDDCNLNGADFTGCDLIGSTFRRTHCRYTNFRMAMLHHTVFDPADAYGMTLTCRCETFDNMHVSQLYWFAFIMYGTLMDPEKDRPLKTDLKAELIGMIGAERYHRLSQMFMSRSF